LKGSIAELQDVAMIIATDIQTEKLLQMLSSSRNSPMPLYTFLYASFFFSQFAECCSTDRNKMGLQKKNVWILTSILITRRRYVKPADISGIK
jgi:hypothetical protein